MILQNMQIFIPAKNLLHYQKNGEISTRICMIHSVDFDGPTIMIDQDKWTWVSDQGICWSEERLNEPGAYYPTYQFFKKNEHFYLKAWEFYFALTNPQKKFDPDFYLNKIEDWYDWVMKQTEEFAIANIGEVSYESWK